MCRALPAFRGILSSWDSTSRCSNPNARLSGLRLILGCCSREAILEPPSTKTNNVNVLIAGAGLAGLSLAIALRQGLGESFSVMVADPTLGRPSQDARASAIVAAARRLFETIGV